MVVKRPVTSPLCLCVQIRARTSAEAGKWSDPTPLGRCAGNKTMLVFTVVCASIPQDASMIEKAMM